MRCAFGVAALLPAAILLGEQPTNFLQEAFGVQPLSRNTLLSAEFPRVSLLFVNQRAQVLQRPARDRAIFRAPVSDAALLAVLERRGVFDLCRIRPAPGSAMPADELKLAWSFPEAYNESMTVDAGALEGYPLYLPDGTRPPAQHLNWGTLFYNRTANLALGTLLEGIAPASTFWRWRSGPSGPTQLHFWVTMGRPEMQLTIFAYRPADERLWWADWLEERERLSPGTYPGLFPVLSPLAMSWAPGEKQVVAIAPAPQDSGKSAELVVIDDVAEKLVSRRPFTYQLPVTHVTVPVGDWPSGLYRAVVVPAGSAVDSSKRDFNHKIQTLVVRPARPGGSVLFLVPTDMWRAYASNGGHAMTSWRRDYHYDSLGYSPTVLNARFRRTNHYYYGLYERYGDINHYRFLADLARKDGFRIDYCGQEDVALGRVRLEDYRLVLVGNHDEFTSMQCFLSFRDYLARGGAVMLHGGDSFAVMVEYLPNLQHPRYIWQRDHIWCHLLDQPDSFQPPQLLPVPSAGSAVDYLNVFHVSVGYWPASSRALVADTDHPVMRGLDLKPGDPVPGPWAGEADIAYEPQAWKILVRTEEARTEAMESGLERVKQPAFHRPALMVHRNLRLAELCGENFPRILVDPQYKLFRTLYTRTLHYLLDSWTPLRNGEAVRAMPRGDAVEAGWNTAGPLAAVRYELPAFIDYQDPQWHLKPAPYAHYVIEGSGDGATWFVVADRTHGPWRGVQTDYLPSNPLRKLRFRGTFSDGNKFQVSNITIFRADQR